MEGFKTIIKITWLPVEKGVKEKRILSLPVEKGLKEQRIEGSRIPSQKSLARVHQDVKMPSTSNEDGHFKRDLSHMLWPWSLQV